MPFNGISIYRIVEYMAIVGCYDSPAIYFIAPDFKLAAFFQ